jgi:hypothetical protein
VANRTTTSTVIKSDKDEEGNWQEWDRVVTTVVERDDDGYPYGPISSPRFPVNPYAQYASPLFSGQIGDYFTQGAWVDNSEGTKDV